VELCRRLQKGFPTPDRVGMLTNNDFSESSVFTEEDYYEQQESFASMEMGGSSRPHASIREDANSNQTELEELTAMLLERQQRYFAETRTPPLLLFESGGDDDSHLSSKHHQHQQHHLTQGLLADLKICVMDGAHGGVNVGPSLTRADLLVVNKMDLLQTMGADMVEVERDAACMRKQAPTIFASGKTGIGMEEIENFLLEQYESALVYAANKPMTPFYG